MLKWASVQVLGATRQALQALSPSPGPHVCCLGGLALLESHGASSVVILFSTIVSARSSDFELEVGRIQTQIAQEPMLRA